MVTVPAGTVIVSASVFVASAAAIAARTLAHVVPVHVPPSPVPLTVNTAACAGPAHSNVVSKVMNATRRPTGRP
jgi:hypothetical protein